VFSSVVWDSGGCVGFSAPIVGDGDGNSESISPWSAIGRVF